MAHFNKGICWLAFTITFYTCLHFRYLDMLQKSIVTQSKENINPDFQSENWNYTDIAENLNLCTYQHIRGSKTSSSIMNSIQLLTAKGTG